MLVTPELSAAKLLRSLDPGGVGSPQLRIGTYDRQLHAVSYYF